MKPNNAALAVMQFIFVLALVSICCSCIQQPSANVKNTENVSSHDPVLKSGLIIENGINRGISYIDQDGNDYNLRYIPVSITNDSSVSIRVQLEFLKEYHFPSPNNTETFRLFPLPEEWAMEGIGVSEHMMEELPDFIENPVLNLTIEPGERVLISIASLYPRPPGTSGVLPKILSMQKNNRKFSGCNRILEKHQSSAIMDKEAKSQLWLKLVFGEECIVMPCGQTSDL